MGRSARPISSRRRNLRCRVGSISDQAFDDRLHDGRADGIAEQLYPLAAGAAVEPEAVGKAHGAAQLGHLQHPQGRLAGVPFDEAEAVERGQRAQRPVEPLPATGAVAAWGRTIAGLLMIGAQSLAG